MYKGVLVCGYTRVCNHVDIRTWRYIVQISKGFRARARLVARLRKKWKDRSRSATSALVRGGKIYFWATYLWVHSYICMYTTSGSRSRGKTVSSLRKRFGARQRNPLPDYLDVYICIDIYEQTLVVTVLCEIVSICCMFYTTEIFVRLP